MADERGDLARPVLVRRDRQLLGAKRKESTEGCQIRLGLLAVRRSQGEVTMPVHVIVQFQALRNVCPTPLQHAGSRVSREPCEVHTVFVKTPTKNRAVSL